MIEGVGLETTLCWYIGKIHFCFQNGMYGINTLAFESGTNILPGLSGLQS